MKKISALFVAAVLGVAVAPVFADADDVKWVKECISDNADQGQTSTTVKAYCTCMNGKMSSSETKSVTEWEKTHKDEVEACAKESGWSGK